MNLKREDDGSEINLAEIVETAISKARDRVNYAAEDYYLARMMQARHGLEIARALLVTAEKAIAAIEENRDEPAKEQEVRKDPLPEWP